MTDLLYLGNGPAATGIPGGWCMRADLLARCTRCDHLMNLDPDADAVCDCGALYKDAAAGRFGSDLGDEAIEVYRAAR